MSYPVLGIPNAGDIPAQSQAQIQTNFNNIIGWAAIDHVGYGATNNGIHNQVTMPAGSDPGSSSGFIRQYAKSVSSSLGTFTELFMQSDGTRGPIQLTRATPSIGSSGYTFLPGGLLLQWGVVSATPSGAAFSFPVTFPSAVFAVTLGGRAAGAQSFAMQAPSTSAVTVYSQSGTQACYIMAIGN